MVFCVYIEGLRCDCVCAACVHTVHVNACCSLSVKGDGIPWDLMASGVWHRLSAEPIVHFVIQRQD